MDECPNCKRKLVDGRYVVRCEVCGKSACYKTNLIGAAVRQECCASAILDNDECFGKGKHKFRISRE